MTTDSFFAPALPQKLPSSFQCDRTDTFSTAPGLKTDAPGWSKHDKPDNFLNNLKKASRNQNSNKESRRPDSPAEVRSARSDRDSENDRVRDQQPADDETLMELLSLLDVDESFLKDQSPVAAFQQLIGDIQSADLKPGNELSAGLEQLRQIISGALTADSSLANRGIAQDGPDHSQSQVSVEIARWAKGIIQGQDPAARNASVAGDGNGTEKRMELSTVSDRVSAEPASAFKEPEIRVLAEVGGSARNNKGLDNLPGKGLDKLAENEMAGKAADGNRNAPVGHSPLSAAGGQPSGGEPLQENALSGDTGSKVVKSEGGSNDGGQWTSQSQTSERTAETASAPKEAESAQRELRTQTMDQIVRRAVFQIKDGQQEARIDLKPDFLGHVRMQVITENQQVTVKILTEFGFVKDMIENNIQQLKADLQQQGLDVDKLDVSVSRDANGKNEQQENMENAEEPSNEDHAGDDGNNTGDGQRDPAKRSARQADGLSTVDYFA